MDIRLMDSSLRDGGNVNDWNFGRRAIEGIIKDLNGSKIDIIELGYLRNTVYDSNRSLYNTIEEAKANILPIESNVEYSLMIQEDKWNWDNLVPCDGIIKHIRVSFHKFDIKEGLELCRLVKENGYICHCNPINIMGYTDAELLDLINDINAIHPDVFSIVDTFGAMQIDDIKRVDSLLQNNLLFDIKIAAHLHENLGLSFSLAQEFINYFENKRETIVDASIMGIGRIPGNLCLELVMSYLNRSKNAKYNLDYIYDAIDDFIINIKKENPWGYAVPYALSATYNLHRTYPEFLLNKGKLMTKDIRYILESIDASERIIYNEEYIQKLYDEYINVNVNDEQVIYRLSEELGNKNVLVVAPGRTILEYQEKIKEFHKKKQCVMITVNFLLDHLKIDYAFFTNLKRLDYERFHLKDIKLIATSNLTHEKLGTDYIVNYLRLQKMGSERIEDSVLCLVNLLKDLPVGDIYLAGFDGYGEKNNYYDKTLDNAYNNIEHSKKVKMILKNVFSDLHMHFITPSFYSEVFDD